MSLSACGSDGEMARRALLARGAAAAAALVAAAGPAAAGDDALLTLPLMKAPQTLFALKPDYTDAVAPSSSTADAGAAAAGGGDADADGAPTARPPLPPLERYVDPKGVFALELPKQFYRIRRTIEGDIIRRGNAIFSAGDLTKNEIVSLERYPALAVAKLEGIGPLLPNGPDGPVTALAQLGKPLAVAKLLAERRDDLCASQAKNGGAAVAASVVSPDSVRFDADEAAGGVLRFEMVSTIRDRDGLIATRRTLLARAQITPGNGELLCLWAGCADVDWQRSEEPLLRKIVETFEVL